MRKKKLHKLAIDEIARLHNMLQARIQVITMGSDQVEVMLMDTTLEMFYLSHHGGYYGDAKFPQWIAGPVQVRVKEPS